MRSCKDSSQRFLTHGGGVPLSYRPEFVEMPKVDGLLPRERGVNWREYLEYGYGEYSKNFDLLWQT
eukprot:8778641-Alexandrium_andersonii.AAC.1